MHVDIWSDVVCPWCYIGKRRFEAAVARLDDLEVDVTYRPFQLDPGAPIGSTMPAVDAYSRKFGGPERARAIIDKVTGVAAADGLDFRLDKAKRANTHAAHRLLWWALDADHGVSQEALKERLLRAYFTEGLDVGDHAVLADLAADVGADRSVAARFLAGHGGVDEVDEQLALAGEGGITAVPTYVVADTWAIPGAQDPDVFVKALRRLADKARAS